jgi:hypothetical protein
VINTTPGSTSVRLDGTRSKLSASRELEPCSAGARVVGTPPRRLLRMRERRLGALGLSSVYVIAC